MPNVVSDSDAKAHTFREPVWWFVCLMEAKLKKKDPIRGGDTWCDANVSWLLRALKQEIAEAEIEIVDQDKERAIAELVDVANYAMMVADKLRSLR